VLGEKCLDVFRRDLPFFLGNSGRAEGDKTLLFAVWKRGVDGVVASADFVLAVSHIENAAVRESVVAVFKTGGRDLLFPRVFHELPMTAAGVHIKGGGQPAAFEIGNDILHVG